LSWRFPFRWQKTPSVVGAREPRKNAIFLYVRQRTDRYLTGSLLSPDAPNRSWFRSRYILLVSLVRGIK
jgi:hypothetical protein